MRRIRTAILISGRGTNMVALIEAAKHPDYPAEIVLVVSNDANAGGLARAQALGVETIAIPHGAFPTREAFETEIDRVLREYKVELVCLAGFMRVLTASFIEKWPNRLLNIHPSLLPELKGLHTHERALAEKATRHGCTVHFVVPELDAGPMIDQAAVPILADDTVERLAERVLEQEITLYPKALAEIARQMAQN